MRPDRNWTSEPLDATTRKPARISHTLRSASASVTVQCPESDYPPNARITLENPDAAALDSLAGVLAERLGRRAGFNPTPSVSQNTHRRIITVSNPDLDHDGRPDLPKDQFLIAINTCVTLATRQSSPSAASGNNL